MIIATLSTCFTTRRFFQVLCQSLHGYSLIGDFFPFPFSFFFFDDEPVVDKSRSLRLIYSRTQTTEGLRRFSIRLLSSFLFFFSSSFLSSSKEKKMVENFVLSNEEEAVKKLFDERDVTRKFRALYSSWRSLAKEAWRCCCR